MIRCPKCSKELENGTKFCDNCGTEIIETLYCPNCGKPVNQDSVFCQSCGAPLTEEKTQRVNAKSPKNLLKSQAPIERKFAGGKRV